MDIFFYEAFAEEAEALKRHLPAEIKAGYTWKTIQETGAAEPPAGLISIRTQSTIPLAWQNKLSGILTRSTGYDHIKAYLRACGSDIACGSLPPYCSRAVAEQAMLAWMSLLRKLPAQMTQFANFSRDGLTGRECESKTLLVVGVGNIGYEITRIGRGLGMNVIGVDIVERHDDVKYLSIAEGLPEADIIVCAMNLTNKNRDYFSYDLLKNGRSGSIFINVARGEMSPVADLLRLLDKGCLSGVALDVFNMESELAVALRSGKESASREVRDTIKMAKRPDVIFTPHNAFNTFEAVDRKSSLSAQQVDHFLKNGAFVWPVPK